MRDSVNASSDVQSTGEPRSGRPGIAIAALGNSAPAGLRSAGQEGQLERRMATKQQAKQHVEQVHQKHEQRSTQIGVEVMRQLGQPEALRRVDVRQLWSCHYRVNVLVGESNATARVAHSFFLVTDEDGNVLRAEPELSRQYP